MILALIYFLIIFWLIRYNRFFGVFSSSTLSAPSLSWVFLLKALAVPVFYVVYTKLYGGITDLDTGKFYHDALILSGIAKSDFPLYLKTLFGFQNDNRNSYDYYMVYNTFNWDNGTMKDFLYNDNRIVIRVHSLLNFLAFDSYFVHALFSCLLSFVGAFFISRAFTKLFPGSDYWIFLSFCFFPALWFHTGALLKEGLAVFVLGSTLILLRQLVDGNLSPLKLLLLLFLIFVCGLLKAYLLIFSVVCFGCMFIFQRWLPLKFQSIFFVVALVFFGFVLNALSLQFKHRSLLSAALKQERLFSGVAKGGIFLYGPDRFVRLEYDSTLVKQVTNKPARYTIRKNASYMYWMDAQSIDTLYCQSNEDTTRIYTLAYQIKPSQSNLRAGNPGNIMNLVSRSFYNCLCYPLLSPNQTVVQLITSLENLLILLALLMAVVGMMVFKRERFPVVVFLLFSLCICVLIGITSPNTGAIFRYRSPAMPFLLSAALYYFADYRSLLQLKRRKY